MTVDELVQRATKGRKFNRHLLFRPSLVYQILHDPFWIWCEHHAPKNEAVNETTRYDEMRFQRGLEFEQAWLRENYPDAIKIEPDFGFEALRNTFQAMIQRAAAIYQPQLWDLGRESYGKGDLLIRDDSRRSDLGPYHYRVVEIKRSRSLQDYHVLQAAFYNRMLGEIQGFIPNEMTVALRAASEPVAYSGREKDIDEILTLWSGLRDGPLIPEPGRPPAATSSPWRIYGNKTVQALSELVLLAGVSRREREKLRQAGVSRVDKLWDLTPEEVTEILGKEQGANAYWVAQAYKKGRPILRPGCRLEIPRARRLLYFDFETSDDVHPKEPPHIYLIGCWDGNRDQYVKFLARGVGDEERIFLEFLDYAGDPRNTLLYHWTDFEIKEMRELARRWPALQGPLEELISRCVDLREVIQRAVYLPVPTFSLKSVAPCLGFRWRQDEIGAYQAMMCYWDYLDESDASAIRKAVTYNEDDCVAMWHVDQELTRRLTSGS